MATAPAQIRVSAFDRLSFTIFLALALHALLLFGISFDVSKGSQPAQTLDVTLVQHSSKDEPEEADFLAQANQQGSGTLDEAKLLTTTEESDFEDNDIRQTQPEDQQLLIKKTLEDNYRIITTTSDTDRLPLSLEVAAPIPEANASVDQLVLNQTYDIATLKAALDEKRQRYANRPRIRTLSTVSTKRAEDAAYVFNWLQKVERVGNKNYPEMARKKRLTGNVRLLVAINPNGSVNKIQILDSSGHTVLDDAAKRIVNQAAPFDAFPDAIKAEVDLLEVIRTWRFVTDDLTLDVN